MMGTAAKLVSMLGVLGLTASMAGCGSATGTASAPTTVTVWSWRPQDAGMWQKVQRALNQKGGHIQIQFRAITPTSYDAVLQTAMDGGQGPDIFYGVSGICDGSMASHSQSKPRRFVLIGLPLELGTNNSK